MDNKVKFLRGTATEYEASTKDNDTFYYTTDDEKLYLGNKEITGGGVTIDDTLSDTSKNPVQNKVINAALNSKADLSDIPTTLPANGGNADTLGNIPASELERVRTAIIAGEASGNQWTAMQAKKDDTMVRAQVDADFDRVLLFKSIDGGVTWTEIPLGNADTLDGKHASDFSQIINLGNTSTDTKTAIGIPYQTTTYWCANWTDYPTEAPDGQGMIIAAHYNGDGTVGVNEMWVRQLYITPHPNHKIWQRLIVGITVGEWTNIADGGNADTLDGLHETSFSRNRGDISDCNNAVLPGTYNAIPSTVNTPYSNYWLVSVEIGASGAWIRQTATICDPSKPNETYRRLFINDRWSDSWVKVNDGGNAMSANHQVQHRLPDGTDVLTYATSNNCPQSANTKVRIMHSPTCPTNYGYNAADNDFWYDIYKLDNNSWVTIKAYDVRGNAEFINSCCNGTWGGWVRSNDGGNAATANLAANLAEAVGNNCLRNISAGTGDLTAGSSPLANGAIYLVYE